MQEVTVTKIQIGFWNAMILMVTFVLASIPALIIVSIIYACVAIIVGAPLSFFLRM